MQLLTDRVFETDNSIKLIDLFYKSLINYKTNNYSFKNFIGYDEFKIIIYKFIIEVMELFLKDNEHSEDTFDVYFKKLPRNIHGLFDGDNKNNLVINEMIIKNMYDGDLEKFMSILHELNHFKVKYDIFDGVVNLDICRIVKERLLRDEDRDPFNEIGSYKSLKGKRSYINDFYYDLNYYTFSEEVYVDICSKRDFTLFMRIILIFYHKDDDYSMKVCDEMFDKYVKDDLVRYDNYIRDLTMSLLFNDNYLNFEEAFDVSVKFHPEWLEYPQISVEYYIDDENKVKKRDSEELRKLLEETSDIDIRKYIEYLIENIEKKEINQNRERK